MAIVNMRKVITVTLFAGAVTLGGCSPIEIPHGYVPVAADVDSIQVGKDTRDSVYSLLGEPTSRGVEGDSSWYYVSYTERRLGFLAPTITDRTILAISFDARGRVAAVNRYGLQDGVVVDLVSRETVTGGRRLGFLEQMLGNIGNFSAESFF